MHNKIKRAVLVLPALLVLLLAFSPAMAQDDEAEILNDEGGPVIVQGDGIYTFPAFATFFSEPYIVMTDVTGEFVDRDIDFEDSEFSQVFGKITSNPFESPFSYQLSLPSQPLGQTRDVDNDDEDDDGVMIFALNLTNNLLGDPFAETRDFSGVISSILREDLSTGVFEIAGGKLIVWAPDDQQGFPSGFGDDGMAFTEDDPIVTLPQGYTIVDFDTDPFTFDRSEEAEVDLLELEDVEANDFSDLSYTEAFDAMVDLYKREYAFTEYKNIDWDALAEEYRPLVEEAEEAGDPFAFQEAVREMTYSVPDGHLRFGANNQAFQEATAGGLGMAIRELDDGRVIVNFITPDGPAEEAGIELRAEIIELAGMPVIERVEETVTFAGPFSTFDFERLQQLRYATRFPLSVGEVEVTYQNPGEGEETTVMLPLSEEIDSFQFSSFNADLTGLETPLPVEFQILESGFGLITINSFSDDLPLTFDLWERALDTMNVRGVEGIIVDLRRNGGGSAYMADQMPAYFFNEALNLGYSAFYDEEAGEFTYDEELDRSEFLLPDEERRYFGEVAVLIGPQCASACESFAYNMTLQDRAQIVGQYTTAGLGGSVVPIFLPDGVFARITNGRSLDADGEIHIEGIGVVPTIDVPVNEETLFSEGDPILEAAVAYLEEATTVPLVEGGELELGEVVIGELVEGERVRYTITIAEDTVLDFLLGDASGELDTYLRLYVQGNEDQVALENDDDTARNTFNSALREIQVPAGLTIVVEVAGFDDAESGEYYIVVQETGEEIVGIPGTEDEADEETPEDTEEGDPEQGSDEDDTEMGSAEDAVDAAAGAVDAAREALEQAEAALEAAREALEAAEAERDGADEDEATPEPTPEPTPEEEEDDTEDAEEDEEPAGQDA